LAGGMTGKGGLFFFERKNQKTFIRWLGAAATVPSQKDESLFASFYSEKEVLSLLVY
jgi:hypothetical protein